jgi:hypothetical protein
MERYRCSTYVSIHLQVAVGQCLQESSRPVVPSSYWQVAGMVSETAYQGTFVLLKALTRARAVLTVKISGGEGR